MMSSPNPQNKIHRSAVFWALISQSIWLPVFLSDYQASWSTKQQKDFPFSPYTAAHQNLQNHPYPIPNSRLAALPNSEPGQLRLGREETGIVLNSVLTGQRVFSGEISHSRATGNPNLGVFSQSRPNLNNSSVEQTSVVNREASSLLTIRAEKRNSEGFLKGLYTRSELLGGTLTLADLAEPLMPPLARAERAQWSRQGDPLSSLPQPWREPMRRALSALTNPPQTGNRETNNSLQKGLNLDPGRLIHVPSSKIRRASEVPLALQSDGSVDILNQPDDPAVIEEIKQWSTKQKLPQQGKILPAVVHLHPLEPLEMRRTSQERGTAAPPSSSRPGAPASLQPSPPPGTENPAPTAAPQPNADLPAAPPVSVAPPPPAATPSASPLPASVPAAISVVGSES